MAKTEQFETKLDNAKESLEKLLQSDITMSDSVKAYDAGMKELQVAQKLLDDALLQVETIKQNPNEHSE
ncbi:MAG: exodeoxyribonuclease VII small subunit [Campylobacterota bacterium]|nr:exodeoxyribonuclease VII small subunit [Campylobacterota bacterium]